MLSDNEKIAMFYGAILNMSSEFVKSNPNKANKLFQFGLRECIRLYIKDGDNNNHESFVNSLTAYADTVKPQLTESEKRQFA